MDTLLTPCRVPWAISPSMSGITLTHSENDEVPECCVVLGGGRLTPDDRLDSRWIEIEFAMCYHARCGPHADSDNIESIGYKIDPTYDGDMSHYLEWRLRKWKSTGYCPDSGFYVATKSAWLCGLAEFFQKGFRHYVLDGRDGYVELIARCFKWREWLCVDSHREETSLIGPVVGNGEGIV